jgi:putative transposase
VIDGGPGLRKALNDVLGDLALVQRCQVHKLRNLRDQLSKKSHAYVLGAETLTIIKLGLPRTLTRSLATTNPIESLMSSVRRVTRNVKRWQGGDMIKRWSSLGIFSAQQRFRRIKGDKDMPDMPILVKALRPTSSQPEVEQAVA